MTEEELEVTQQECPSYKKGLCMSNLFNVCRGQCETAGESKEKEKEN